MSEREIRVRTADGEMTTFIVHPDGDGPYPVAAVYMDAPGYREQVKANARRLAADGYYCVVPDLFYRSGDGITVDMAELAAANYQGPPMERMMALVTSVKPEMVRADTEAIFDAIASDPAADLTAKVCIGYCMGARFALHVASTLPEDFVAAAGIHPGPLATDQPDSPHHELASVRGELYFAFAETDHRVPPEMVDKLRDELGLHGVAGVVETAPGTLHGFAMADLPVYEPVAAERHFERTLDLWRRNLAAEPARTG